MMFQQATPFPGTMPMQQPAQQPHQPMPTAQVARGDRFEMPDFGNLETYTSAMVTLLVIAVLIALTLYLEEIRVISIILFITGLGIFQWLYIPPDPQKARNEAMFPSEILYAVIFAWFIVSACVRHSEHVTNENHTFYVGLTVATIGCITFSQRVMDIRVLVWIITLVLLAGIVAFPHKEQNVFHLHIIFIIARALLTYVVFWFFAIKMTVQRREKFSDRNVLDREENYKWFDQVILVRIMWIPFISHWGCLVVIFWFVVVAVATTCFKGSKGVNKPREPPPPARSVENSTRRDTKEAYIVPRDQIPMFQPSNPAAFAPNGMPQTPPANTAPLFHAQNMQTTMFPGATQQQASNTHDTNDILSGDGSFAQALANYQASKPAPPPAPIQTPAPTTPQKETAPVYTGPPAAAELPPPRPQSDVKPVVGSVRTGNADTANLSKIDESLSQDVFANMNF